MVLKDFDAWARGVLPIDEFQRVDSSINGIQVGDKNAEIRRIAFAVDACLETFKRAAEQKADMIFVHHGIFWGKMEPLTGSMYDRVSFLTKNNIALYGVHLPLDMHPELGNNIQLAKSLGLTDIKSFGDYKGKKIGYQGTFSEEMTLDKLVQLLPDGGDRAVRTLPFGPEKIKTAGVISGGAPYEISQAIAGELDIYITGETSHSIYHLAQESGINVLFGGHYQTEIFGVKAMAEKIAAELNLDTFFVDVPTGL